jgi:xanthine dehydrogenase molybdenum-binding subunit
MGAKEDGTLTAIEQKAIVNVGAAVNMRNYHPSKIIWTTSNLYVCPNVSLEQVGVFTNMQLTGPTRAPLNMTAIFALESHVDRMAEQLGIDPLELRLKNYTTTGITHINPELLNQEMKVPYLSKKLKECMHVVTEAIGWEKKEKLKNENQGPKRRGIGMAGFMANQGAGAPPYVANADITIENDGTITLFIGIVDIGGGQQTIFSMITAEELGVEVEDIKVVAGDTKNTRYGPSCHTSRCTAEMGPPVLQAAAEARHRLFEIASVILDAPPELLDIKNSEIFIKSEPSRSVLFKTVCKKIDPEKPIKGSGSRDVNPDSFIYASFGAQAAEVEVDVETGEVNILRLTAAQDFGKAINPKLCFSQIYGGIEFGLGYALSEAGIFDKKTGKMLNNNLCHYKVPTALDIPHIDAFLVESHEPEFAYSARGGAEVTNTPTPAAIRNAIYNAAGIWLNDLPITPDKIIEAVCTNKKRW